MDDNVTRHIDEELARTDWDILVLHYLGLDHIGHLDGPRSLLVQPKLREMDRVVQHMVNTLRQQVAVGNSKVPQGQWENGGTTRQGSEKPGFF